MKTRKDWLRVAAFALVGVLLTAFSTMPDQGIEVLRDRGNQYRLAGKPDSCIATFQRAIDLYGGKVSDDNANDLAAIYCDMGVMQALQRNNYLEAFRNLTLARGIAERHRLDFVGANANLNLANLYSAYGDRANTAQSLLASMRHGLRLKDQSLAVVAFRSLVGEVVTEQTSKRDLVTALEMFDSVSPKSDGYHKGSLAAKAARSCLEDDLAGAIDAATMLLALTDSASRADERMMLGCLLARAGSPRRAAEVFSQVWNTAETDYEPVRLSAAKHLIEAYRALGVRDSTLLWHERWQALNDSLYSGQNYGLLRDVACDIEQAQASAEIAAERARRSRAVAWLWIAVGFVVVLGAAGAVIVRQNAELRRRNRALFERDTEALHRGGNQERKAESGKRRAERARRT